MGRRERPIDPRGGPLEQFAHDLRALRRSAGSPSYQELARRTHFAASTLAASASGKRLPSAAVLAAYVSACGGDTEEWEKRRLRTRSQLDTGEAPSGKAAAEPAADAVRQEPGAAVPRQGTAGAADAPGSHPPAGTARTAGGGSRRRSLLLRLVAVALLLTAGTASQSRHTPAAAEKDFSAWLHPAADVPHRYRSVIVEAGTMCTAPQVTPALVAAMLKVESNFDAGLYDPAAQEYGIARWTPRVLRYYLPEDQQHRVPVPPLDPRESILALGRMLCTLAPQLEGVAGDPVLNLAAAYRTATFVVQKENGVPGRIRPYTERVRAHLMAYAPEKKACLPYAATRSSYPAPCPRPPEPAAR
ncbi:helix-turn-helix domain-containing protein [Streptomyces sp. KL2]|uniref:helix-turn-helix domain-containing protein n=1 Tax=Streptomyces sp. KL2 TaxID=3050126 RepID=UPI00397E000E